MVSSRTVHLMLILALGVISLPQSAAAQIPAATDMITNGDVNLDGMFDIFDIMRLERTVALGLGAKDEELSAGDVDGNGRLDKFDLLVLNEALSRANEGQSMFDAVKSAIEGDLSKATDNVETYLDLSRFFSKENMLQRSRSVLESILEALETDHPLYNQIVGALNSVRQSQMREIEAAEDFLNQDPYEAAGNMAGKTSLRRSVVQLKGKLSKLMNDQQFSAHYNSKRVKSQLGDLMDDMLRKVGNDQMVDAGAFDQLNTQIRGILENPENLVKQLTAQQRNRIKNLVDTSTIAMRQEAVRLNQDFIKSPGTAASGGTSLAGMGETTLNRNVNRLERNLRTENMSAQGRAPANAPLLQPDTISLVTPQYVLSWDVSNILGAKNAALEIGKANAKFSNPRGTSPDKKATLFYTPSLGTVKGERRGNALELEGVGTYYYRVAALNTRGELISRFSDATPLAVVHNNLNIAATRPDVDQKTASPQNPDYSFHWDVSNVVGARDAAVEITKPDASFGNPNGRARDRLNAFFFNPSLGRISGTYNSSINGLAGPGRYLFRVIAVSANSDFMGQWSDPETLFVTDGEGSMPYPEPGPDGGTPELTEVPQSPEIESSDDGFSVKWDVGTIDNASGVNFELARLSSEDGGGEVEEVIISEALDSTSGRLEVDSGLLDQPGRYQARVAAVDSAGNLLSSWSEPSILNVERQGNSARDTLTSSSQSQETQSAQTSVPAGDESASAAASKPAQNGQQAAPSGKGLEVSSNNTPLYEQNNPSSHEIASLQKGEKLILVVTNGLWHNVYYPMGGKYGWVLSFNVIASD
ncbi:MAG: hypothetical protein FVQ81_06115 [Candidatus Glassbacteria bacterium]|nr:hypothetical protein [Candidatus Glassbacteria bacterium]